MKYRILFSSLGTLLLAFSCVEPYEPSVKEATADMLVVEAFLDGTSNSCTVKLSRSQSLSDDGPAARERFAQVVLHTGAGVAYTLVELTPGAYTATGLPLQVGEPYRIRILTQSNEEIESETVTLLESPSIDNLAWRTNIDGIEITVDTRGTEQNSRYYRWEFEETWEYHSPLFSNVKFENGRVVLRTDNISQCWKTQPSTQITIGTSQKLSENLLQNFPVLFIPKYSQKYLKGYSVLVKQYSISKTEFEYWAQLKKNTENLGTLFDPQPSRVTGNFRNLDGTGQPVLGFFSASTVSEQRLFFKIADLPVEFWFLPHHGCTEDTLLLADVPFFSGSDLLTQPITINSFFLIGYGRAPYSCVDCRAQGGTNVKPDFWP